MRVLYVWACEKPNRSSSPFPSIFFNDFFIDEYDIWTLYMYDDHNDHDIQDAVIILNNLVEVAWIAGS